MLQYIIEAQLNVLHYEYYHCWTKFFSQFYILILFSYRQNMF